MPTEKQQNSVEAQPIVTSGAGVLAPDEFLSLRDILIMILRHRRAIFLFVLLVTLAASIFFITRPRQYAAEGYLQVIPPVSRELEAMITSYLQKASSAYIVKNVANLLNNQGIKITSLELEKQIKITRPPRTDLIRLVVRETSADKALLIVQLWVREYLESIQKNNIHVALSQTRLLLKQAQSDLMEKKAMVDEMKVQVAQTAPLITLSRAVDDRQLWSDLTQKAASDPEALKKLSEIHIKSQEQSTEYINLKMAMLNTEQVLWSVLARRNLYQEAVRILETKIALNDTYQADKTALTNVAPSESKLYVDTLIESSEVIQFGEPGLISSRRGALKKTGLFFLASLGIACFGAFMCEWGKGLLSSR